MWVYKMNRKLTLPLESICSAANTTPPQRGQPCPSGALMVFVLIFLKASSCPFLMNHLKVYLLLLEIEKRKKKRKVRDRVAHEEGSAGTKTVAFRTKFLGVAKLAVNIPIRSIASEDRVQDSVTFEAVEASFVPNGAAGQHLLRSEDSSTAAGATVPVSRLDSAEIRPARSHLLHIANYKNCISFLKICFKALKMVI